MHDGVLKQRPGSYTRGEDTRRRILDAALEIFAAEGYEGASTRVLAERAGVNLPAIQYYFGNKEGLYRAVIESIIRHKEAHMAPHTAKVKAALADPATPHEALLDLLCEIFESFVDLVSDGQQVESRRLLYARAEIEQTPGLEMLHESGIREIFEPCLALVGRLLGKPVDDPEIVVHTLALFGQVTIFCNKPVRRVLKMPEFTEERATSIRAIIRSHTQAVIRDIARSGK